MEEHRNSRLVRAGVLIAMAVIALGLPFAPSAVSQTKKPSAESDSRPATCKIKGDISSSGERLYHVPGQRYYSATKINPQRGERWFCRKADARAAGWRRSRR